MSWKKVPLGDLLVESRIPAENPDPNKRIRVKLHMEGVEKRPLENEMKGATKQFIRRAGQFIYGKQNFHKGAFGVIPDKLDGFETSADIPSFDVREDCLPEWIYYFFKSGNRYLELEKLARGVGSQRIHPKQIFNIKIPLPPKNKQYELIQKIIGTESNFKNISEEQFHQLDLLKKLRQQMLQDAVQGKLVPQDPNDEPASKLLERIKAEKEQLIREKKTKKGKPLPEIKPEEIPFEIPANWVWCRLGELANSLSTGPFGTMLHKSDYVKNGIPLINPMNMIDCRIIPSEKMMVSSNTINRLKSYILSENDVVIARRGELGRCAIVTQKEDGWLCGTGSFFLSFSEHILTKYFIKVFSSEYSKKILKGASVGSTMNNLNHRVINNLPIPIPPYSEQNRIITKIEQLMTLCNKLEQSIMQNHKYTQELLQVALKEALEPKDVSTYV